MFIPRVIRTTKAVGTLIQMLLKLTQIPDIIG
jgi:hypothetical protein